MIKERKNSKMRKGQNIQRKIKVKQRKKERVKREKGKIGKKEMKDAFKTSKK